MFKEETSTKEILGGILSAILLGAMGSGVSYFGSKTLVSNQTISADSQPWVTTGGTVFSVMLTLLIYFCIVKRTSCRSEEPDQMMLINRANRAKTGCTPFWDCHDRNQYAPVEESEVGYQL